MNRLRLPESWNKHEDRLARYAAYALMALGITMRIIPWMQNRNLIIDEANIARNLVERSFRGLTQPLAYEQYAPPVFLWIEKIAALTAGIGEMALRFPALLAGLISIFLFRAITRHFMANSAALLSLGMFCTSYLLIRYSSEVKQYMPDVCIALALVLLALRTDIRTGSRKRFFLIWLTAGSLAVWTSMPAVFMLAGIGAYYACMLTGQKERGRWLPLIACGALWAAQFGIYYILVLKEQANSAYLQNFHRPYFLILRPASVADWKHNSLRIKEILGNAGSAHYHLMLINCVLMAIGMIDAFRKREARLLLLVVPLALTLLAAGLKQFSLIDRVVLFLLPLLMLLIGRGAAVLLRMRLWPVHGLVLLHGLLIAKFFSAFWIFRHPMQQHEITQGFDYLKSKGVAGRDLFIHHSSIPTYIYYTTLHPRREAYREFTGAHLLDWATDFTPVSAGRTDTAWFLITGGFPPEEKHRRLSQIGVHMIRADSLVREVVHVYGYRPRSALPVTADSVMPN